MLFMVLQNGFEDLQRGSKAMRMDLRLTEWAAKQQGARWGQLRAGWEHPSGAVR